MVKTVIIVLLPPHITQSCFLLSLCVTLLSFVAPPSDCFQALRCQKPFPGPRHRQPQTQQSRRQTPHARGAGHHRLKNQVRVRPAPPLPPAPSVWEQRLNLTPAVCCRYESGDHVAVFPTNDTALVNRLGQILDVNLDVVISLNNLDGTTLAGKGWVEKGRG